MDRLIQSLFHCPRCRGELLSDGQGSFACRGCGSAYALRNGVLDFGAREQAVANNWSGESREEAAQWVRQMLDAGFLTEDDLEWMRRDVDRPELLKSWEKAVEAIRDVYRSPRTETIVDLASGLGSVFSRKLGGGLDLGSLGRKTIVLADLSRTALEGLRERLEPDRGETSLIYAACDVATLPLKDGAADAVSGVALLANAERGEAILGQIARALRSDGRFALYDTFFEEGSRSQRIKVRMNGDLELTTLERMEAAAGKAGLAVAEKTELYRGRGRMAGDLLPLSGEEQRCVLLKGGPARS